MSRKAALAILLFTLLAPVQRAAAMPPPSPVTIVYGYHLKPPFIIDPQMNRGLYFDFSHYINARVGYELLQSEYMPRKRLESELVSPQFSGLIIGVNPLWFHDPKEQRYFWTAPIMRDRDEVLSRADHPIEYNGPDSLVGKVVGLSLGYYYFGIDELVAKHKITREDTDGEVQNIQKLLRGRIDATIVSRSTLDYYLKHNADHQQLYVSGRPHDVFDRRILVPHSQRKVYDQIAPLVSKMADDPLWQAMVAAYK